METKKMVDGWKMLVCLVIIGAMLDPCSSSSSMDNVFEDGNYETQLITVESSSSSEPPPPPKPLLVATPTKEGEYPVVMLLHGYFLDNTFYSQLLLHVASHGFILIAPQLYSIAGPNTEEEIKAAVDVINWISTGLSHHLPPQVTPNLTSLALAGHSRGGKVAFALALKKIDLPPLNLKLSALIGIDPVDGSQRGKQTPPPVLTYEPKSFDLNGLPVLVIGSGLGETSPIPLTPSCAPEGVNHRDFFKESQAPAWHLVAKDYGHMDMLDDDTGGVKGKVTYVLCKNGKTRKPMRRFVGGIHVAFLKAYVLGNQTELFKIKDGSYEGVPLEIEEFEVNV